MKKKSLGKTIEPYIWLLPSILLMVILILVPIITVFETSFCEISKAGVNRGFNGIDNFKAIFQDKIFWHTLWNTLVWTVVVVVASTIMGFIMALVLNKEFHGRKIARAILVFPWATALIIQSMIWKYIINADYGAFNLLLYKMGLIDSYANWTASPGMIFAWECWVGIFVSVPFITFCVLSGLQSIDQTLYEAADVDGATFWSKLFNITLPLVMPSLTVSTVLSIIYVFNSFPIVWTISKGDPADQTHTLVTYLYKLSFVNRTSGEAAAVSVIGFLVLAVISGAYMITSLRKEKQEEG